MGQEGESLPLSHNRVMALRGKHRDVRETRHREEQRVDTRLKVVALSISAIGLLVAVASLLCTLLR